MNQTKKINLRMLGAISYKDAIELQENEKQNVLAGQSPGSIFFLEHIPPVITMGRHSSGTDILLSETALKRLGYLIEKSSRGGNVTVHEPGQLIIYYVLPLKAKDTRSFVFELAESIVQALNEYLAINLFFDEANPGIWHENKKCASIGFDLRQQVSMHGIAINVCNSLLGFSFINPCGMPSSAMTSLSRIAKRDITVAETAEYLAALYSDLPLTYPAHDTSS